MIKENKIKLPKGKKNLRNPDRVVGEENKTTEGRKMGKNTREMGEFWKESGVK